MEHFTVEVEPNAVCDRQDGWEHDAWQFTVTSDSGYEFSSIFRTGVGLRDRVAVESELEAMVLESVARDAFEATQYTTTPTLEDLVCHHVEEYETPLRQAFEYARKLLVLVEWFDRISLDERGELEDVAYEG